MAATSHSLVRILRGVHDFSSLDDATLLKIVGMSVNLAYAEGTSIFAEGSASLALYLILSGRVRIGKGGDPQETGIAELGPGESFGEISLIRRTKHTRSAVAVEDTELMVLPSDSFEELLATNPHVRKHIEQRIAERETVRGDVSETAAKKR